jgi:GNAT superfamily N-acetyltransferase
LSDLPWTTDHWLFRLYVGRSSRPELRGLGVLRHEDHTVPVDDPNDPRLATEVDLPAMREIVRAAYGKYLARMDRPPAPMIEDMRRQIQASEVWLTGQPIKGLICLRATDDSLFVENVAVHPAAQGTGLGRHLLAFAEEQARRRDFKRLWLYTNEVMTENVAIYAHLGYRETDRRSEDGYQRVFMEKVLQQEQPDARR